MTRYYHIATRVKEAFTKFKLWHIVRENNERANLLSKLTDTKKKDEYKTINQEEILELSLNKVVVSVTPVNQEWITEIWNFLEKGSLLEKLVAVKSLKRNASYYVIERENLYRRGFTAPLLKYLTRDEVF